METDLIKDSANPDEIDILSLLIKEYERVHYPVEYPNPIEAIKLRMKQISSKK